MELKRKQIQIPITNYVCSDCGENFWDKEKVCEHFLKVHKKKIAFPDTKKTENLPGPSQVAQQNNLQTVGKKCELPIPKLLNLDFHKKICDGPKDYDGFERSARKLINEHYSRYPSQFPDKLGCGLCGHKFTQKMNLERHILTMHYNFKMHPCLKCSKLFTSKQILDRHFKTVHHNFKEHPCQKCTKRFTSKQIMDRHFKTVHKGDGLPVHLPTS